MVNDEHEDGRQEPVTVHGPQQTAGRGPMAAALGALGLTIAGAVAAGAMVADKAETVASDSASPSSSQSAESSEQPQAQAAPSGDPGKTSAEQSGQPQPNEGSAAAGAGTSAPNTHPAPGTGAGGSTGPSSGPGGDEGGSATADPGSGSSAAAPAAPGSPGSSVSSSGDTGDTATAGGATGSESSESSESSTGAGPTTGAFEDRWLYEGTQVDLRTVPEGSTHAGGMLWVDGEASNPATGVVLYEVVPGDTMWSISQRAGVPLEQVAALNAQQNPDPDLIYPEQSLVLGLAGPKG